MAAVPAAPALSCGAGRSVPRYGSCALVGVRSVSVPFFRGRGPMGLAERALLAYTVVRTKLHVFRWRRQCPVAAASSCTPWLRTSLRAAWAFLPAASPLCGKRAVSLRALPSGLACLNSKRRSAPCASGRTFGHLHESSLLHLRSWGVRSFSCRVQCRHGEAGGDFRRVDHHAYGHQGTSFP